MPESSYETFRFFLKDDIRKQVDFSQTDQNLGLPPPPLEKPNLSKKDLIPLAAPQTFPGQYTITLHDAIRSRESRRNFSNKPLTMNALSFLLWATQGIRKQMSNSQALRTVPSAGARHALETYLAVSNVEGLVKGFYRYLPIEHSLIMEKQDPAAGQKTALSCFNQSWISKSAVFFMWAALPARMEWRYGLAAHRVILIDAGHICQNLYLASEAIGSGTCAVAAYDQEIIDHLLGLDGKDEFVIYCAAVGNTS